MKRRVVFMVTYASIFRIFCSEVTNQLNEYITKYFLYTLNDSQNKTCTTMKIEKKVLCMYTGGAKFIQAFVYSVF
jgi:hypothetical protein